MVNSSEYPFNFIAKCVPGRKNNTLKRGLNTTNKIKIVETTFTCLTPY
jgi:hypothetical protein